jgi:hypothetical protein
MIVAADQGICTTSRIACATLGRALSELIHAKAALCYRCATGDSAVHAIFRGAGRALPIEGADGMAQYVASRGAMMDAVVGAVARPTLPHHWQRCRPRISAGRGCRVHLGPLSRINRVIDRSQVLNRIADEDKDRSYLKADIPRLKRRAALLNRSVFYATMCAIVTSLLIIVAFVSAMLNLSHEYGVAIFFIVALAFFLLSLVNLARETRIGLHDLDHYT